MKSFSIMHNWMFAKLNQEDLPNLSLANIEIRNGTPTAIFEKRPIPQDNFDSIKRYFSLLSHLQLAQCAFYGFEQSIVNLISCLHMDEDGKIVMTNGAAWAVGSGSTLFCNIASNGKRLIDNMEKYIGKDFGLNSTEYQRWKAITSLLFDKDLVYSFCYELRDVYAHEEFILNLTSFDKESQTGYLVVNFNHEICSKRIKKQTRQLIDQFKKERLEADTLPRRNIGIMVQTFFGEVASLYDYHVSNTIRAIKAIANESLPFSIHDSKPKICVVANGIKKKGYPSHAIFYPYCIQDIQAIEEEIRERQISNLEELEAIANY